MELITRYGMGDDFGSQQEEISRWKDQIMLDLKNHLSKQQNSNFDIGSSGLTLSFAIQNRCPFYLVGTLKIVPETSIFSIKVTLMSTNMLRCKSTSQKTTLIRYLLNSNPKRSACWKINPPSGEIYVSKSVLLGNITSLTYGLILCLAAEYIQIIQKDIESSLPRILQLLNMVTTEEPPESQQSFLSTMKTYIQTSSHYAWTILQGPTKSKRDRNRQNTKSLKKAQLLKNILEEYRNDFIMKLCAVFKAREIIEEYDAPSKQEDQALKQKYLTQTALVVRGSSQVQHIQLEQRHMDLLRHYSEITIRLSYIKEPVQLFVERFDNNMVPYLSHEYKVLRALPQNEFIGIARHYYCSNLPPDLQNIRLTHLGGCQRLPQFMAANSQTMSMSTKLSFIYQLSVSLKYIRDSSVVFHGLEPNYIFIKKKMVKLSNFTNSYINSEQNTEQQQNQFFKIYRCKLPYVVNFLERELNSFNQEKSDVYSLGMVMLFILMGDTPFHLSQRTLRQIPEYQLKQIFEHPAVMAPQKLDQEGLTLKMLLYVGLKAITVDDLEVTNWRNDCGSSLSSKTNNVYLAGRPYLDWMVILLKKNFQYFHRLVE